MLLTKIELQNVLLTTYVNQLKQDNSPDSYEDNKLTSYSLSLCMRNLKLNHLLLSYQGGDFINMLQCRWQKRVCR